MSSIDYDINNGTTLQPQTLISKTDDGDRAIKISKDGLLLEYDILTTQKTFELGQNGFNWTDGVDTYTTTLSRISAVQTALQAVELPPNATTLKLNDTLLLDDGTASTTINSSSISISNPTSDIAGSYNGSAYSLQTDATGSSVGIANLTGSAVNTAGTLISSLDGGIIGIASPPYPAPDATWSLGVNSSTNNPALVLGKSAPFENTTNMTLNLNNLTHNQAIGSPSPDDNFTISTNKNLILSGNNVDLSSTGKLTIINDSVGGATNPLLVLQNNTATAGSVYFETYKNDTPTSTGGDFIGSWSATCNATSGGVPVKTEIARINQIAYGVGGGNNDGGISLACKVNSNINTFLICNGGVSAGEIQVFKKITAPNSDIELDATSSTGTGDINLTAKGDVNISAPTGGYSINLTSSSNVNIEATGDNLVLTGGNLLELNSTDLRLANTATASSGNNSTSVLSTGSNIGDITSYLKLKLNGSDIWLPYFTTDPS